ncbi:MAG: hypothetical protein ACLFQX_01285 [Candidatus Kapaibacterium sp.]
MHRKYFVFILLFLFGCSVYQPDKKNEYAKNTRVMLSEEGNFEAVESPAKGTSSGEYGNAALKGAPRIIRLEPGGKKIGIKNGEIIDIQIPNIDISKYTLKKEEPAERDSVYISLVETENIYIKLMNKCDVQTIHNIDFIPPITVADGLNPEQIVITPLFDEYCHKTGYQIRYGSSERGCRKEASKVLKAFNECVGKRKTNQSEPECLSYKMFGIPCP